jgi:hypothetical protein
MDKYIHHITILKFETANDLVQFNNKQLIRWYFVRIHAIWV